MQKTIDGKKLHIDIVNLFVFYCMERSTRNIESREKMCFKFTWFGSKRETKTKLGEELTTLPTGYLKRTVSRDFLLQVIFINIFPQAPENTYCKSVTIGSF
jgi:hypothetical protein